MTSDVSDVRMGMSLPFVLQRQLPDLGVQALDIRAGVTLLGRCGEHLAGALEQLGAPLADLIGMNLELLDQGAIPSERGQRHFRFEGC